MSREEALESQLADVQTQLARIVASRKEDADALHCIEEMLAHPRVTRVLIDGCEVTVFYLRKEDGEETHGHFGGEELGDKIRAAHLFVTELGWITLPEEDLG